MVEYIIQISDIHIRSGNIYYSRYDEYINVFENLKISLENEIKKRNIEDKILITVCGDIFHHKNKVENYGLNLFKKFLEILLKIGPTILIPGNHDFRQDFKDEPNLISSLTYPDNSRLYVMDKTEIKKIENIQFSTVSVFDTLIKGETCGIMKDLPEFPIDEEMECDYKIALFHGSFGKTRMNTEREVEEQNSYPLEWIKKFDYGLLGDIHLRQCGRYEKMLYGYSGSLIQQNFGEEALLHGYYIWDLKEGKAKGINVYNKNGYITLSMMENEWKMRYKGKYERLEDMMERSNFPKNIKIRINNKYIKEELKELEEILRRKGIEYEIQETINVKKEKKEEEKGEISYNYIEKENWINYIKEKNTDIEIELIERWIKNPETLIIPNISEKIPKINERNKTIEREVRIYNECIEKDIGKRRELCIKYIWWEYLLCYGENCWFNFDTSKYNVVNVNGKNASGKSSFYEIICYALYGESIPSRYKKDEAKAIINYNKLEKKVPKSEIYFELNGKEYVIKREYHTNKVNNSITYKNTILKERDEKEPIKIGKKAIEIWLEDNVGDIKEFLAYNMITQNLDNDILSTRPEKQLEILDEKLRITTIKSYKNLLNETKKSYKYIYEICDVMIRENVEFDEEEYERRREEKRKLEKEIKGIKEEYDEIFIDYNKYKIEILEDDIETKWKEIGMKEYDEEYINMINYKREKNIEVVGKKDYKKISKLYNERIEEEIKELEEPNKPSCSEEFVREEREELKEWLDYKMENEMNNSEEKTKENCEEEIEKLKEEIEKLYEKKPNKPEKEVSTEDIKVEELRKYCEKNKNISKPKEELKYVPERDIEELRKEREEKEEELLKLNEKIEKSNEEISIIKVEKTNRPKIEKERVIELCRRYNEMREDKIEEKLKDYEKKEELMKEYEKLEKKDEDNKEVLKNYKDLEYNPECYICCKQPWLIYKKTIEEIIEKNERRMKEIKREVKEEEYEELREKKREYEELEKINYEKILEEWEKYEKYERKTELNEMLLERMRERTKIEKEKREIEKEIGLNEIKEEWEIYNSHQKLLNYVYNEWYKELKKKKKELCKTEEKLKKIELREKYKREYEPRIERFKKLEEEVERYKEWEGECKRLNEIMKSREIIEIEKELEEIKEEKYVKEMKRIYPLHKKKKELKEMLMEKEEEYKRSNNEYIKLRTMKENYEKIKEENDEIIKLSNKIKNYYKNISKFNDCMEDFKDWLYNNYILKEFLENINICIRRLSSKTSLSTKLNARVNNNVIEWLIEKEVNGKIVEIPIQKGSGFQRFVISLSVRLVLIDNNFKQLFIDEGFVHCDDMNLQLVPEFLYNLTEEYGYSIVVVSHLNTIKDNISDSVSINIKNGYSKLNYGRFIECF